MESLISSPYLTLSLTTSPIRRRTPSASLSLSSSKSSFFTTTSVSSSNGWVHMRARRKRRRSMRCTCLFGLGVPELVVIAGVSALLFGPKNLPDVGKTIGKTVKSFQQSCTIIDLNDHAYNLELKFWCCLKFKSSKEQLRRLPLFMH